jgi:chromate reductase, NAD(P)H dehydrogenase (quinone)
VKLLGISGSLRGGSYNTMLLRAARELLPDGVELELYDGLAAIPPYDQDVQDDAAPEAVEALRQRLAAADAVLIATPEYNGSIPGVLKNALDWASRPLDANALRNKPAAVIGASTGAFGAVWAQADLRKVLGLIGARVVEGELAVGHAQERFDADGHLVEQDHREQLAELLRSLAAAVELRAVAA